jgi:hypothetical protein
LSGFEDFEDVVGRLKATGARREADRVFVVDRALTPLQVAALLDFVDFGKREGFLQVDFQGVEPVQGEHEDLEAWWFGSGSR